MPQSDFDKRCYALLKRIPRGKVTTYKLLAEAMRSHAYRAVGNAMARNRDLVTIPCHRVVRSDGSVGGYAQGSDVKTALLRAEGVTVTAGKVDPLEAFLFTF